MKLILHLGKVLKSLLIYVSLLKIGAIGFRYAPYKMLQTLSAWHEAASLSLQCLSASSLIFL